MTAPDSTSAAPAGSSSAPVRARGRGPSGFGLPGMRERAELLGGRLEVITAPGRGTTVRLILPSGCPSRYLLALRPARAGAGPDRSPGQRTPAPVSTGLVARVPAVRRGSLRRPGWHARPRR